MNYSGHVTANKNLLKVFVKKHQNRKDEVVSVDCANVSPVTQNFVAGTAASVFSSFIGGKNVFVQNAEFTEERFTDHVSFALYKKQPVVDVGKLIHHSGVARMQNLIFDLFKKDIRFCLLQKQKCIITKEVHLKHYSNKCIGMD